MNTRFNQRWSRWKSVFRESGEVIKPWEYEIAFIADDKTAKAFVLSTHYSKAYVAARFRIGLYRRGQLSGVAVFSMPCNNRVLTSCLPGHYLESVELGRFVLLDHVQGNGETYFLSHAFTLLRREGIHGVVSFSDPVPRVAKDNRVLFCGHVGTIYQAASARYIGRGTARTLLILPDGRVLSERAISKIRQGERGWRYAAALLEGHGAPPAPEDAEARRLWLKAACAQFATPLAHSGTFKYVFALKKNIRRFLPPALPYPKALVPPKSLIVSVQQQLPLAA